MTAESVVVLASGGLNSTVAAALAAKEKRVNILYIDHAHPAAARERTAVRTIARAIGADNVLYVDLPHVEQIATSARHAESGARGPNDEPGHGDGAPAGLMPTMLCAAFQWAVRANARAVVTGTSQIADELERNTGPGQGASDHRREFFQAFGLGLEELRPPRSAIRIETPLMTLARADILKLGLRLDAPLEATWCCHRGGEAPCGRCPGCTARADAYRQAGEPDPILDAAR